MICLVSWKPPCGFLWTVALVKFSVSCAISFCASSASAYSFLEIAGNLTLSGKAMGKCSLFLPRHYCFYDYVSVTTIISKEAQEIKKFAFALLPGEMTKQVLQKSLASASPCPNAEMCKSSRGRKELIQRHGMTGAGAGGTGVPASSSWASPK